MNALLTDDSGFVIEEDIASPAAPEPKRRGRKPKGAAPETAEVHAEGNAPDASEAAEPKRRKSKAGKDKLDTYARQIFGFHQMVAVMTGQQLLAISEAEARQLATSGLEVAQEFDLEVGGKYAVLIGFGVTAAMIYVPRALFMMAHVRQVKATRAAPMPEPAQPYAHNAPIDPSAHVFETMPKVDPTALN